MLPQLETVFAAQIVLSTADRILRASSSPATRPQPRISTSVSQFVRDVYERVICSLMEQFRGIGGNDILEVQFVDVSGAQLIQSDPDTLAILAHGRVSDLDGQLVVR